MWESIQQNSYAIGIIDLRFDQSGLKEFIFLSKTAEEFCFVYKEVSLNIAESFKSYSSLFIITVTQLLSDGKIMMSVFDQSSFRVLVFLDHLEATPCSFAVYTYSSIEQRIQKDFYVISEMTI